VSFVMMPVFNITRISSSNLAGVVIKINQVADINMLKYAFYISIGVLIGVILLSYIKSIKRAFVLICVVVGTGFFAIYLYNFFIDTLFSYIPFLVNFFYSYDYFALFYFALFMFITIIFYVLGFLAFLFELYTDLIKDKYLS